MKAPFAKILAIALVVLVCGSAVAVVVWRASINRKQQGESTAAVASDPGDKPTELEKPPPEQGHKQDNSGDNLLAGTDDAGNDAKISERIETAALKIRENPDLARSMTQEILNNGNPDECKFHVLALGAAGTEQARTGLLEILISDADSKMKMLAAAAYAMTSPEGRLIRLPLPGGGIRFYVKAINDETVLRAISTEWKHTEDTQAKGAFFELLDLSAGQSQIAASALWTWILDGESKSEVLRRAADLARSVKSNPGMQKILVAELLNKSREEEIRFAAARILRDSSAPTTEESRKVLLSAARNQESDLPARGFAFNGMDTSTRSSLDLQELNVIIGSKEVPDDIRIRAIKEIRRRAKKKDGLQ